MDLLMFGFIKKVFVVAIIFFNFTLSNVNSLERVSMNNQECKIRSEIMLTLMNLCFILIVLK